jgi:hypothetical protein
MTDASQAALVRRLITQVLHEPGALLSFEPHDQDLVLRLLRRSQLLGRVASQLGQRVSLEELPAPLGDHLVSALVSAEARSRVGLWELDRIGRALGREMPEPLVVLKGCAYLMVGTPNSEGRSFSDVDLLAPKSALSQVESRLKSQGWINRDVSAYDDYYYRSWAHELPPLVHRQRQVEVDLHHNLLMATARLKPSAELLLADARPLPGSRFWVLSPIDMSLHAITHLFMGEMEDGLRELADIDGLLRHFGEHEPQFWERFWARAVGLDLARPAFYGLRYSQEVFATPVPETVIAASQSAAPPAPVLSLMDRLLPDALFPPHPDGAGSGHFVPAMLLARAHWLRMPPLTLARHLGYKFFRRHWPGKAAGG